MVVKDLEKERTPPPPTISLSKLFFISHYFHRVGGGVCHVASG